MTTVLIGEILSVVLFFGIIGALLAGFPVAFTLAGTSLIFAAIGWLLGAFDPSFLGGIASRYFGAMTNDVLVAVPLFIFMGVVLEKSGIAEQLLTTMGKLFGPLRGGLGLSVIFVGMLLAAATGIVGATVVTMGLLSLPAMLRAGYDDKLACGVICASGTLGQIIPPSTVLIFMGDIIQGANADAQREMGNYAPEPVSVGQLFAGALLPGLVLVGAYMLWVVFVAVTRPRAVPATPMTAEERRDIYRVVAVSLVPPLLLIFAVLGSILGGIATPSESASVGAVGASLLAALRRRFTLEMLRKVMRSTMEVTSMVFVILLGASVFSLIFRTMGGDTLVHGFLESLPGGVLGATFFVMAMMFVLGFILDTFEIIFVVVPITAPALLIMGLDPVWLAIMIGVNLQTSFLTPPFGFSLFYLRGVAPESVTTAAIYRGAIPFVALQVAALAVLWFFPELATWLPEAVYG